MFVDEARIAAGLHHRNIVQIIDFDLFDGGAFLVTEYVEGCDLRTLMRNQRGPIPYSAGVAMIAELATGLDAAHDATDASGAPLHLVHRDVSPSNVLLGRAGNVKIADFGVAKAKSRSYHTVSGTIKGKAPYMAPEQILGEPLDRRADVFSLGTLLFEVTTRSRLFSAVPGPMAMAHILSGDVPDPAERRPGYPPALAAVVRKALARDREQRFPTARALVDALDDVALAERWSQSPTSIAKLVEPMRDRAHGGSTGSSPGVATPTPRTPPFENRGRG
jgi:eukaryotic-like serine/threonine-protein kinase